MVLGEQDLPLVLQLFADQLRDPELLLQPDRHRFGEGTEASRERGKIRGEEPLEFQERLVVESDVVQIFRCDLPRLEAVLDGLMGEPLIVLLASEALLGGGSDQAPMLNETGGGVMIEGRDPQDVDRHQNGARSRSGLAKIMKCSRPPALVTCQLKFNLPAAPGIRCVAPAGSGFVSVCPGSGNNRYDSPTSSSLTMYT